MASGSRSLGQGSAGTGEDALATLTNPDLARLPAVDLVVHLHRDDRRASDFADVALVLTVRERRLAEAKDRLRAAQEEVARLRDRIRALELEERRLTEAEAQVRAADGIAAGLRDTIRVLSNALARDRTVADEGDESRAGDLTAGDIGAAELTGGEIRARDLAIVVPELGAGEITPGDAGVQAATAADAEVGDSMPSRSPSPLMRIDASPVPVTGAPALPDVVVAAPSCHEVAPAGVVDYREEVSEAIAAGKRKVPAADIFLPLDELRVTGSKVSEEEAHGEDVVAASSHRLSQGGKLARATKKARRQKGTPIIYFRTLVLKDLMVKQELMKKKEKEAFAKEAAAAASKQLHCRCWWSDAPCWSSKSAAVEDDSDDGESSEN